VVILRLVVASCAWLSAAPACGLLSSGNSGSTNPPTRTQIAVEVDNRNWSDITVYLMTSGLPQRLGMVTALSNATFVFPSLRVNTGNGVRLRALPVAGTAFTTETILVLPGQAISWTVENDLDASSFTVY
jgi:hypothetical protein